MSSFDLWPFDNVRSVGRRGDLEVLTGTAPDGAPVTITRITPDAARDSAVRQRFKDSVDAATRAAGPDDPPILWADTATLVPWAATYDDPAHRGAELIGRIFVSGAAATGTTAQAPDQTPEAPGQWPVSALDPADAPATYHTGAPGYQPMHGAPPPPPGSAGGPPPPAPPGGNAAAPRTTRAPLLVASGVGGLVLVLLLGTGISLGLTRDREPSRVGEPGSKVAQTSTSSSPSVQFSPGPSASESSSSPTPTPTKPTVASRKAVSVHGPTWKTGDDTYTMAFHQLGWAFRAPGDFDCLVAEDKKAKTRVNCLKLGAKDKEARRVLIVNRTCTGKSCSAAERKKCETDVWGDKPKLKVKDSRTKYLAGTGKLEKTKQKVFGMYMGYYYEDSKGNLTKHVFVYADAPPGKYAKQIQKTVNDIRSQAH